MVIGCFLDYYSAVYCYSNVRKLHPWVVFFSFVEKKILRCAFLFNHTYRKHGNLTFNVAQSHPAGRLIAKVVDTILNNNFSFPDNGSILTKSLDLA